MGFSSHFTNVYFITFSIYFITFSIFRIIFLSRGIKNPPLVMGVTEIDLSIYVKMTSSTVCVFVAPHKLKSSWRGLARGGAFGSKAEQLFTFNSLLDIPGYPLVSHCSHLNLCPSDCNGSLTLGKALASFHKVLHPSAGPNMAPKLPRKTREIEFFWRKEVCKWKLYFYR